MHNDKKITRACAIAAAGLILAVGTGLGGRAFADEGSSSGYIPVQTGWVCRTDINSNPQVQATVTKRGSFYSIRAVMTNPVAGPVVVSQVDEASETVDGANLLYAGSSNDASLALSISENPTPPPTPYPSVDAEEQSQPLGLPSILKITRELDQHDDASPQAQVFETWCLRGP